VTRYAAECAQEVLAIFEADRPDDVRPRAAVEAAWAFVHGAARTRLQRVTALEAHRAAKDATTPAAQAAAPGPGGARLKTQAPRVRRRRRGHPCRQGRPRERSRRRTRPGWRRHRRSGTRTRSCSEMVGLGLEEPSSLPSRHVRVLPPARVSPDRRLTRRPARDTAAGPLTIVAAQEPRSVRSLAPKPGHSSTGRIGYLTSRSSHAARRHRRYVGPRRVRFTFA
jgi:hypothetical protein